MTYAAFRSIGAYIPSETRTNQWFVDRMDTSEDWIIKRTGISERKIASTEENTSDLGAKASAIAISRANITPKEIDLVICATISPDFFVCHLQLVLLLKNSESKMLWLLILALLVQVLFMLLVLRKLLLNLV